ncbi:thioredoxin-dependent thiol peroxidase [Agrococcus jejuensis]|jgi:peroxiredoxin Q/BCP|uniref:thioredoxin-dependent thiol peroxidase n=1 Tax=Agrococcus jejuensis TaxID=399736 RepID=UPI0011A6C422|nr:thioredoxin-dependent thiol peroxidase [Agrococcus jejuensis]
MPLAVGDLAPDFVLPAHDGSQVRLSDLRGQRVILWFYPEAMSPGCTQQACDFRDSIEALAAEDLTVLGISRDSVERLARFAERDAIPFPLLSDEDLQVHLAYDTFGEKQLYGKTVQGVRRTTLVVDAEGRIEHAFYNTKAKNHVEMLRKRLGFASVATD